MTEQDLPLMARPKLRRIIVLLLSAGVAIGGGRVWENAYRSRSLRSYMTRLTKAQAPFLRSIDPAGKQSLLKATRDFGLVKIRWPAYRKLTDTWEQDFKLAKDQVAALNPPAPVKEAQAALVAGIDEYVGVARLLSLAAQLRQTEEIAKAPDQKGIEAKVQVEVQQAQEEEARAEAVYALGSSQLAQMAHEWLGAPIPSSIPGVPSGVSFATAPVTPSSGP